MRKRRSLFAALGLFGLLLYNAGCDSADNPIAPSGSVLIVTANPLRISANGQSTITVRGFKPDNNPLNEGTIITLSTTFGTLDATSLTADGSGQATTVLRGSGSTGAAEVMARLPGGGEGEGTGSVTVQIGDDETSTPSLSITASPNTISLGESAEVTAVARNSDGSLIGAGTSVSLRTDLGTLRSGFVGCGGSSSSSITVETNSDSEAEATLCAGDQTGTATIIGSVGSSMEAMEMVTIENQVPQLTLSANPSIIPVNGTSTITIIARDDNGLALGEDLRIRMTADFGHLNQCPEDGGAVMISEVFTDSNGEACAVFQAGSRANPSGSGAQITAILGTSEPVSVSITIRDAPASFSFQATPRVVNASDDGVIMLSVQVLNAQGDSLPGATVIFGTEGDDQNPQTGPGGQFESGSPVHATNSEGQASDVLTIPQNELAEGETFFVTAEVRGEGADLPKQRLDIRVDP